jgi:hypothetical protein
MSFYVCPTAITFLTMVAPQRTRNPTGYGRRRDAERAEERVRKAARLRKQKSRLRLAIRRVIKEEGAKERRCRSHSGRVCVTGLHKKRVVQKVTAKNTGYLTTYRAVKSSGCMRLLKSTTKPKPKFRVKNEDLGKHPRWTPR